jgi:hypothetical protein
MEIKSILLPRLEIKQNCKKVEISEMNLRYKKKKNKHHSILTQIITAKKLSQ